MGEHIEIVFLLMDSAFYLLNLFIDLINLFSIFLRLDHLQKFFTKCFSF